jgi:hypothetical protein
MIKIMVMNMSRPELIADCGGKFINLYIQQGSKTTKSIDSTAVKQIITHIKQE